MSNRSSYKQQRNLSAVQLLAEAPTFITTMLSAIFSGTLLLYVDLLDSLSYIIRNAMVILLSRKLSKDLRFEYNYGVGKIEAFSSLLCDGIVLFGMFLTLCLSVYSIMYPSKPSDLLLAVVGLKLYDIMWEVAFFLKQRKIHKLQHSAASESNYAAALGTVLFDGFAVLSLLGMWLLRNNPIGGYISPFAGIIIAAYLTVGCIKRIRKVLAELTDKTLPEDQQMKILNTLTRHFDSYSQFHHINSHKSGDVVRIDLHFSFDNDTSPDDIVDLKEELKSEFDDHFGESIVNIIVERNSSAPV